MKVWVVFQDVYYEGYYMVSIHDSQEKAQAACDKLQSEDDYGVYEIAEHEVL